VKHAQENKTSIEHESRKCAEKYINAVEQIKQRARIPIWLYCPPQTPWEIKNGEYSSFGTVIERNIAMQVFMDVCKNIFSIPEKFKDENGVKAEYFFDQCHLSCKVLPGMLEECKRLGIL
jgi:hypothetical protein